MESVINISNSDNGFPLCDLTKEYTQTSMHWLKALGRPYYATKENRTWHFLLTYLFTYLLTYLLTYSMQYSPSWEADRFSASQEIPRIIGTPRFITAFSSSRHLSLSWARWFQSMAPTSHFLKIHFNIILPSTPCSSKWSLSFSSPHENPFYISFLPNTCYMTRPSHSSRFDHPNNIGRRDQTKAVFIN